MNGPREARSAILHAVSDWMKLLALMVLGAELVILTAMGLTPDKNAIHAWYPVMMLLFLVVIVAGVFFDRYLQSTARPIEATSREEPRLEASSKFLLVDQRLEKQIEKVRTNIHAAAALNVPTLTSEIAQELEVLVIESRAWSRGEIQSSVQRYRKVLLDFYEQAKYSIFSTANRDYIAGWQEELMEGMIAASEKSEARSITRVFVFAYRDEIDTHAITVLRRFRQSSRIRSLVYIDHEDERFDFPPDISRDFVVVDDGEAIGITLSYGPDNLRAQWFFRDEERKKVLQRICASLVKGSYDVDRILKWWDERSGAQDG